MFPLTYTHNLSRAAKGMCTGLKIQPNGNLAVERGFLTTVLTVLLYAFPATILKL